MPHLPDSATLTARTDTDRHWWLRRYPNGRLLLGVGKTVHIECETIALGTRDKFSGLWTWAWNDATFSEHDRVGASHAAAAVRTSANSEMYTNPSIIPDPATNLALVNPCCTATGAQGIYRFDTPPGPHEMWVLLKSVKNVNYPFEETQ